MNRLLLPLLFLPCAALAQPIDSLAWLAGTWLHEKDGARVTEAWIGPGNGLMVGANLTARADGRRSFEFLRIAESGGALAYLASPGGRAPVEFRFREGGERRVVFENPAHDFPQRILYRREGDALVARIEGTIGGKARAEEWRFTLSAAPPAAR